MSVDYGSASRADATSENLIRSGTVVDRQLTTSGAQVKVVYPDRGVTSAWIPVSQQGSAGGIFYYCPRVGDNVLVSHMPTGIESGMVIGTNPTPNNPAFTPRSINAVALQMDDKSYFEHDPDVGCLSINGVATIYVNTLGQIQIIAAGDIDVTTEQNLNITVTGNVVATIQGNLTATVSGTATMNVTGNTTITTPTLTVNGNLVVNGNISTGGGGGGDGSVAMAGSLNVAKHSTFNEGGTAVGRMSNTDGSGGGS